ncbi:hypothetical protein BGZ60DRAFT_393008 [Tricladium varicosporioides]|nr:hypothetical protein BGZ60DRAFT_393008 [Hymenoscyphus varicosporioides]
MATGYPGDVEMTDTRDYTGGISDQTDTEVKIENDLEEEADIEQSLILNTSSSLPQKRRTPATLSTNPHTKKARDRREKLMNDPITAIVERAKEADTAAKRSIRDKIRKQHPHLKKVDAKHFELVALVEQEWKIKLAMRTKDGVSAPEVARRLGFGAIGGKYAEWDDGNPAWEDDFTCDIGDDDWEYDAVLRSEEKDEGYDVNMFQASDMSREEFLNTDYYTTREALFEQRYQERAFRAWQSEWRHHAKTFFRKVRALNMKYKLEDAKNTLKLWQGEREIGEDEFGVWDLLCRDKSPMGFFNKHEKAIFRNLCVWKYHGDSDGFVDLPGPARFWKGVSLIKCGFRDPSSPHSGFTTEELKGFKKAWKLVYTSRFLLETWKRVSFNPIKLELRLLPLRSRRLE